MRDIRKFIFLKGKVETLSFFSEQIMYALEKQGFSCMMFDFEEEMDSFRKAMWFVDGETALFTFNFIGLSGEKIFRNENQDIFWKERNVLCINMLVDHPFYYHEEMKGLTKICNLEGYLQFCVDKDHVKYCKRFFKGISECYYLPLAGTFAGDKKPYNARKYHIVFAGNYSPLDTFLPYFQRTGKENEAFYWEIIDYLKANPEAEITATIEKFLKRDFPEVTEKEVKDCLGNSMFLDLYIRFYFRGQVIRTLVDAGLKVDIFGGGWEDFPCKKPENLILHGQKNTLECLQAIRDARISLNVMPWFKKGAHDRVYSSILNGAVCVTDRSVVLEEELQDRKDVIFYDLEALGELPGLISGINYDNMETDTIENMTWTDRTEEILRRIHEMGSK